MKEQILKLRSEGKSYREIERELGCSRSLIAYHANGTTKTKILRLTKINRYEKRKAFKELYGGKCVRCGYEKCLAALQFHHIDPTTKKFELSNAIWGGLKVTYDELIEEANKCELLCANCHAELHSSEFF